MLRNRGTMNMVVCLLLLVAAGGVSAQSKDPRVIVSSVVKAMGGKDRFYERKSIEYTYVYEDPEGKIDRSTERYVFDGELSWARYDRRDRLHPEMQGVLEQGYDGTTSWATLDGRRLTDPEVLRRADFQRKTNFYWFAMMFKLLDPGLRYEYDGAKTVDGVAYDLVRIGFEDGVGDASDTYVLYVNRRTRLVDRFLFTVMDFDRSEPLLMLVEYEEVDGIRIPAKRKYCPSDWDGKADGPWTLETMTDIRLNVPFEKQQFLPPGS